MPNFKPLQKCIGCACMSKPFRQLSTEQLIAVNKNRVEVTFKKGENIFKQGVLAGNLVYVKSGLVKIYLENGATDYIVGIEGKGKLLGIQALVGKNIYPYSVQTYTETQVCLHDLQTIKSFLTENAKFSAELLKDLSEDSLFAYDRTACLTLKQLHGRFADLLLCLSLRIYKRKKFIVPITKKELAAAANMSQESLSRVIKDFVNDRIIEMKGTEISILDFEKIRHLSMVG